MNIITIKAILVAAPAPTFVGTRLALAVDEDQLTFGISNAQLATGRTSVTVDWGDGTVETFSSISETEHTYAAPGDYEVGISDDIDSVAVCNLAEDSPYCDVYPRLIRRVDANATRLTSLGYACFSNCDKLSSADLADSAVTTFARRVFGGCSSLTSYRLPHGLVTLGNQTFQSCESITAVDLPRGVRQITSSAFKGCTSLSGEIALPFVEDIPTAVSGVPFSGCTAITAFHFAKANEETIRASTGYKADPTLGTGSATCVFDL